MSNPNTTPPTLFLIDSMSLVFQAFYAIRNLRNAAGMPTNAVYGFARQLQKLIATHKPSYIVAVFDSPGPSFRSEIFKEYKANRVEAPDDFKVQLPYIFRLLDALGIPHCAVPGYEADDIIGTLASRASAHEMQTMIVSADKDLFQIVDQHISMLRSVKDDMQVYGVNEVKARMGVGPERIAEYLALVGDTSDNIPGAPGIGPKTAVTLLDEFGGVEQLLERVGEIKNPRQQTLISSNIDQIRMSHKLSKINCDVPLDVEPESFHVEPKLNTPDLARLYQELGFLTLLKELGPEVMAQLEKISSPDGAIHAASKKATELRLIQDLDSLKTLVAAIHNAGKVALDTETSSIDPMNADLVGISFSYEEGIGYYIPLGHELEGDADRQLSLEQVQHELGPVLSNEKIVKIAQNAKFDLRVLHRHGLHVRGLKFDTMLASYLLDPEASHGLKSMAQRILGVTMTRIDELIGSGKFAITMAQVEIGKAAPYAAADADLTLQLAKILGERLEAGNLDPLFNEVEMPLVEVLDAMEAEGVTIDANALRELSRDIQGKSDALVREIFEMAGHPFNIKSTQQVAEVLFQEIGLKPGRKTTTGDSTGVEVLEDLAKSHPLPARILDFRHLEKMKSTYVDALPQMINRDTGRIHTCYNQTIAATGRLSSSNPNLQNIPVRTPLGRQIRKAFVPNESDHVFLAADYSQIELRILAHISGDDALRRAFEKDIDIHAQTASRIFSMPIEMVTSEMRDQAKVINFGILYGMSAHRLSRELSIPRAVAAKFIEDYFAAYPRVAEWRDKVIEEARRNGYVTTLIGRRRMTPNLDARDHNLRQNAIRMAVNTPIQGTSADMIKKAMIALHREIVKSKRRARMVLQVHDELVFSVPEDEIMEFEPIVGDLMSNALPLAIPVRVDTKIGRNWAEC